MNLFKTNLNLLKVFMVLMQEKNTSLAAKTLHITQPAISNSLSQLRDLFKDELFIRGPKQMTPTQKALLLAPKIEQALRDLESSIFYSEEFDYQTSNRQFVCGMSDYAEFIVLPKLYKAVNKLAPNVSLKIRNFNEFDSADFENGLLDLGIGPEKKFTKQLNSEQLFTDKVVCVAREKNPIFEEKLSLKNYLKAEHLAVCAYASLSSRVDEALGKSKLERKIKISLPDMLPAFQILASSDLLGSFSEKIIEEIGKNFRLKYVPCPVEVPVLNVVQIWHRGFENDSGLMWLRKIIKEVCDTQVS